MRAEINAWRMVRADMRRAAVLERCHPKPDRELLCVEADLIETVKRLRETICRFVPGGCPLLEGMERDLPYSPQAAPSAISELDRDMCCADGESSFGMRMTLWSVGFECTTRGR